jgi:hypothetical protein
MGQAQVAVPAGTFDTYVVQAVQRPEDFGDPKKQTVFAFTWWYAPAIAAVGSSSRPPLLPSRVSEPP